MVRLLFGIPFTLALALSVGIGPVFADIDIFTSGTVGEHSLRGDTPSNGGVICRYDGDGHLVGATMRPPIVYAIDKNGRRNSQRVGWRLLVDRYDPTNPGPGAQIFYTSPRQVRIAYDDQAASFSRMKVKKAFPKDDLEYRFFGRMLWFRADGSIQGESVHVVSYHKRVSPWAEDVVYGHCVGTL
jgi:hypothetical protein